MKTVHALFNSRSFVTVIGTVITIIAVRLVPELKPYATEISTYIVFLVLVLIGGWKVEDFATKWKKSPDTVSIDNLMSALEVFFTSDESEAKKLTDVKRTDDSYKPPAIEG